MNDISSDTGHDRTDLISTEDGLDLEDLPEGAALGTFGTTSTASSASCPVSSAGSVMTAS